MIAPLVVGALLLVLPPSASASIRFVTQWGSEGAGDGQFQRPYGVATDSADNVYVVEFDGNRVDKFTSGGAFITKWGSPGSGAGQFTHAQDIAVGASDNVYVLDTGNARVEEFTSSGNLIRQWGEPGSGNGQFDDQFGGPTGIATDAAGNVYVADNADYGRVQKFDSTGTFLTAWDDIELNDLDVAVDSAGYIYLDGWYPGIHGGYNYVGKYDQAGNYLTTLGSFRGEIPASVAAGLSGQVVAVSRGERAREFVPTTGFTTEWGAGGSGIGQFDSPGGVAINSAGRIYVADTDNNRIQVFRRSTALPNTTVAGPQGTIRDSTPTFRFSSPDLDATFICSVDGGDYKTCYSPRRTNPLANGPHTFSVRATDPNGTDPTPAVHSFTLEATDSTAVGVSGSTLVVTAASGVTNNIRIARIDASRLRVTDGAAGLYWYRGPSGSSVKVGAHCNRTDVSRAECPLAMIDRIKVTAGDDDDVVQNKTGIPSSLAGGGGFDNVVGGSGPDTLIGGPGSDYLWGHGGNDLILARDGADDRVDCFGGNDDRAELDSLPLDDGVRNCETSTRR
ncbi:MAG: hypothetical protein ACRDMH_05100 [Solirubrobacterales bacterium]